MKRAIGAVLPSLFVGVLAMVAPDVSAYAQTPTTSSTVAEEKLEQDFTDPLTTLPQLSREGQLHACEFIGPCSAFACFWDKWYLRSAEANWMISWRNHSPTTLPLSIGLGRTWVRQGLPPMSLFITGQWMVYRQDAPIAPQTTIDLGMTVAFPQLRSYWGR